MRIIKGKVRIKSCKSTVVCLEIFDLKVIDRINFFDVFESFNFRLIFKMSVEVDEPSMM